MIYKRGDCLTHKTNFKDQLLVIKILPNQLIEAIYENGERRVIPFSEVAEQYNVVDNVGEEVTLEILEDIG